MTQSKIFVKKLRAEARLPTRGSVESAGADLYSAENAVVPPRGRLLVKTGISIAIPKNTYFRVSPRSGLALKHGIDVMAGVIDSDYRGEVCVILSNFTDDPFTVAEGDRVAQGILEVIQLATIEEVEDLDVTERGAGAFGSTGK